ncbi:hypothetical protein THAOC_34006 [Thalassiosira oceanica]|uniref:Uncharacterized protein n=1 Tax=Thalassiosira oceanica TaxID=159749 RepID=K0R5X2_THAOC|nr:hypothetical protein THAOC_34006 [Thalassiosira oceanica]|eukprot:EJK47284.1 hypothetical protein THAOC_34006 [Thalassiosira oceanica]
MVIVAWVRLGQSPNDSISPRIGDMAVPTFSLSPLGPGHGAPRTLCNSSPLGGGPRTLCSSSPLGPGHGPGNGSPRIL